MQSRVFSVSFISWVPIYFFTQNSYSFWIGPFLLHSGFGVWLYAFQQHLFYQHFLQHSLHITTAEIWFHLRVPYDVWKSSNCLPVCQLHSTVNTSSVTLRSIKQCYFLFTFSTANSFKKETMKIVYCQHHITIKFPFIGTWNCSLVNAEFTHKLSLKTSIFVFRTPNEMQIQFCACQKKEN